MERIPGHEENQRPWMNVGGTHGAARGYPLINQDRLKKVFCV